VRAILARSCVHPRSGSSSRKEQIRRRPPEILEHIDGDETAGIDRIAANDMNTVSLRHAPGLAPALRGVINVFALWNRTPLSAPA
jgi:hypothetical protein